MKADDIVLYVKSMKSAPKWNFEKGENEEQPNNLAVMIKFELGGKPWRQAMRCTLQTPIGEVIDKLEAWLEERRAMFERTGK